MFFKFTRNVFVPSWPWAENCVCFLSHQKFSGLSLVGYYSIPSDCIRLLKPFGSLITLERAKHHHMTKKNCPMEQKEAREMLWIAVNLISWRKKMKNLQRVLSTFIRFFVCCFRRVKSARHWSVECVLVYIATAANNIDSSRMGKLGNKREKKEAWKICFLRLRLILIDQNCALMLLLARTVCSVDCV